MGLLYLYHNEKIITKKVWKHTHTIGSPPSGMFLGGGRKSTQAPGETMQNLILDPRDYFIKRNNTFI